MTSFGTTQPYPCRPQPHRRRNTILLFLAVLALALLVRLVYFVGTLGSDDLTTWQVAYNLSHGVVTHEGMTNRVALVRLGPAFPAALIFRVFGISELTAAVWPLIGTLLGIAAAFDIARRITGSVWAATLAGTLIALAPLDIQYSTTLLPDGPMVGISLVVLWCIIVGTGPATQRTSPASRGGASRTSPPSSEGTDKKEGAKASRRPAPTQPRGVHFGHALLLFFAGLLIEFAMWHKVSALQLVVGVGLWGLVLLIRRSFPLRLWLVPLGFVLGHVGELYWFHHYFGSAIDRWRTITQTSDLYAVRRLAAADESMAVFDRVSRWIERFWDTMPAAVVFTLVAVAAALLALIVFRRHRSTLLIVCYAFGIMLMRVPELTKTYSYQPRRLLPLVGCGAILIAILLCRWRRPRSSTIPLIGAVLVTLLAFGLVQYDGHCINNDNYKLAPERWLYNWTRDHADQLPQHPLYTDERTAETIYALHGFADMGKLGIFLLPSPVADDRTQPVGRRPAEYQPGGYYFENPRVMDWLHPYVFNDDWARRTWTAIPDNWTIDSVVAHRLSPGYNAALFHIPDATPTSGVAPSSAPASSNGPDASPAELDTPATQPTTAPAESTPWQHDFEAALRFAGHTNPAEDCQFGWYVYPDSQAQLELRDQSSEQPSLHLTVAGSEQARLITGSTPFTRSPGSPNCFADSPLVLHTRCRATPTASGAAPRLKFMLIGYTRTGTRETLVRLTPDLTSEFADVYVPLPLPPGILAVRLMIDADPSASYDIAPFQIEVPSSPTAAVAGWAYHAPQREHYQGWHIPLIDPQCVTDQLTPENEHVLSIDFREGLQLELYSGRGGPTVAPREATYDPADGLLQASVPIRCTPVAGDTARMTVSVLGYDEGGTVATRSQDEFTVGPDWHTFRTYLPVTSNLRGVRVMLVFQDHGQYELRPVRLATCNETDELPDLGFTGYHRPVEDVFGGWGFYAPYDVHDPVRITDPDTAATHLLVHVPEGRQVKLASGRSISRTDIGPRICPAGQALYARFPVHTTFDDPDAKWVFARWQIFGYTRDGRRLRIYDREYRIYYPDQQLRAYAVATDDLHGLKFVLTLEGGARLELEPPLLDRVAGQVFCP